MRPVVHKRLFSNAAVSALIAALLLSSLACQTATPTATSTLTPTITPSLTPTSTLTATPVYTATPAATPSQTPTPLAHALQWQIFTETWNIVDQQYLYPDFNGIDWNAVKQEVGDKIQAGNLSNDDFYELMRSMIFRLNDDHSIFLSPEETAGQEQERRGELSYVGIGVSHVPVPEKNLSTIIAVYPGSPAEEAGLQVHDNLLEVEGEAIITADGSPNPRLRGLEGTTVTLLVQTPGETPRTITITRRRVEGETPVLYHTYESPAGKRVGYILLNGFSDETSIRNFRADLRAMSTDTLLGGLIIDNRMNPGGSLGVMLDILSFFMEGPIGALVERDNSRIDLTVDRLREVDNSGRLPVVVFVGPHSASAGELFPGILRDQGRAYIIGETTPGNVEALSGFNFDDGSRMWLATNVFQPANDAHANWEATGIIPDETVITRWEEFTLENDPAVEAALKYFDGLK